jgi:hypothetical protein
MKGMVSTFQSLSWIMCIPDDVRPTMRRGIKRS